MSIAIAYTPSPTGAGSRGFVIPVSSVESDSLSSNCSKCLLVYERLERGSPYTKINCSYQVYIIKAALCYITHEHVSCH